MPPAWSVLGVHVLGVLSVSSALGVLGVLGVSVVLQAASYSSSNSNEAFLTATKLSPELEHVDTVLDIVFRSCAGSQVLTALVVSLTTRAETK